MKKILIYQHGGSKNHGCEALAITVAGMLEGFGQLVLSSHNPGEDTELRAHFSEIMAADWVGDHALSWILFQVIKRLMKNSNVIKRFFYDAGTVRAGLESDMCIAIGGDNYCYDCGKSFWGTDCRLMRSQKPVILWGASLEPRDLKGEFLKHLSCFTWIIARESITFDALRQLGFQNISLIPDSAFTLQRDAEELTEKTEKKKIGINLSPMILNQAADKRLVILNYIRLIEYLLVNTEYEIMLIPHVVWKSNDDRKAMGLLKKYFREETRVILTEDSNCMQLKTRISRCELLVAARTHAVIAGYSQKIPTLAVGYSVKASGLAHDIFGSAEHYVTPAGDLKTEEELLNAFLWISERKEQIKAHLNTMMDGYIERASLGRELIREYLETEKANENQNERRSNIHKKNGKNAI